MGCLDSIAGAGVGVKCGGGGKKGRAERRRFVQVVCGEVESEPRSLHCAARHALGARVKEKASGCFGRDDRFLLGAGILPRRRDRGREKAAAGAAALHRVGRMRRIGARIWGGPQA